MRSSRFIIILSVSAALVAGFFAGRHFRTPLADEPQGSVIKEIINQDAGRPETVDFGLFWQVWNRLHERYVDKDTLDTELLLRGAIEGMVMSVGDPYTVYLEPVRSQSFNEEISGKFGGVGMEINVRDGRLTVISPLKDTPAFRAGIKSGDYVTHIDDVFTDGMDVQEAVDRIRGDPGTTVVLKIERSGVDEVLVFTVTRDVVRIPSLEWVMLEGNVAYLQLFTFNQNIDADFARAAREILDSGADRLIVDLRNNPGGLLDSAVNLAGWFLPADSVVVLENFGGGVSHTIRSSGGAQLADLPTVFLINGGSASASEILAGAVHDLRHIPLVGEQSYGKGSVQQLESFNDGSSLKVTVAKWLTPAGVSISDFGIAPTHQVLLDIDAINAGDVELGVPGKDPQLDKAVEIVNNL
ncbi:MAG TPA: S41 family peptidase [Candidatus Paceibacterota bacterium]|nr:S41 family peptidase [Candidatus Paceibacterota bacterium]